MLHKSTILAMLPDPLRLLERVWKNYNYNSNFSHHVQNLVPLIDALVMENAELQQQLQSSTHQLTRKEADLTRAEKTIRREQQQMRQLV